MEQKKVRIYLYDSTLRDGAQARGVDFSVFDKEEISAHLDELGIDYIEGGFPGANPTDDAFFSNLPKLKKSKIVPFGMTRKSGLSAEEDPNMNILLNTNTEVVCIFGKTWDFHVINALEVTLEENISMISESVNYLSKKEVIFDAEHFFDGYKANPEYALEAIKAAYDAGARWIALCDTNGGTLPHEIFKIVQDVVQHIPSENLGIHCHNDTDNAVANSIAAVRAGVRQVQGTIGGYGERCGNTNLISIIPTLAFKMGFDVGISPEEMKRLTHISNALDDRLDRKRYEHAAYVGVSAFAHKGGLHVSAVMKNPEAYEHINPKKIGNENLIVISDQAGLSNIVSRLRKLGFEVNASDKKVRDNLRGLIKSIKEREKQGYAYDSADASFELLARIFLDKIPEYYKLLSFRVIDERRWNARGELVTLSEAKVKIMLGNRSVMEIAEGNGPVNALNKALKKGLAPKYKQLQDISLIDYKVRIITPERGTEAITRVQIESADSKGNRWSTIGVSENIIDASYNALHDAFVYRILHG